MTDSYYLPVRRARVCQIAGIAFLLLAAVWGLATVAGAIVPGLSLSCDVAQQCNGMADPTALLADDEQVAIARDPAARVRFEAHVAHPGIRIALAGLTILEYGPLVWLFAAVGMMLRCLGGRGRDALARALPWLRHGSRGAIAWTVAQALVNGLRSAVLYPGTARSADMQFPLDLNDIALPFLLAVAAYATAWALEAGIRAERDLADFV